MGTLIERRRQSGGRRPASSRRAALTSTRPLIYAPQVLSSRLALVTRGWPVFIGSAGRGGMPMNSALSLALSEFSKGGWAIEPSNDPPLHPTERNLIMRARLWLGKVVPLAFARFLMFFFIGVVATLAWQFYGGAAREAIASVLTHL